MSRQGIKHMSNKGGRIWWQSRNKQQVFHRIFGALPQIWYLPCHCRCLFSESIVAFPDVQGKQIWELIRLKHDQTPIICWSAIIVRNSMGYPCILNWSLELPIVHFRDFHRPLKFEFGVNRFWSFYIYIYLRIHIINYAIYKYIHI